MHRTTDSTATIIKLPLKQKIYKISLTKWDARFCCKNTLRQTKTSRHLVTELSLLHKTKKMIIWFPITMLKISVWGDVCRHSRTRTYHPITVWAQGDVTSLSTDRHTASIVQHSHFPATLWIQEVLIFHKLSDVQPLTAENPLEDGINPQSWAPGRKHPQRFLRAVLQCSSHSAAWSQQCNMTKIFGIGCWMEGKNFSGKDYNFICKKHRVHTSLLPSHL